MTKLLIYIHFDPITKQRHGLKSEMPHMELTDFDVSIHHLFGTKERIDWTLEIDEFFHGIEWFQESEKFLDFLKTV